MLMRSVQRCGKFTIKIARKMTDDNHNNNDDSAASYLFSYEIWPKYLCPGDSNEMVFDFWQMKCFLNCFIQHIKFKRLLWCLHRSTSFRCWILYSFAARVGRTSSNLFVHHCAIAICLCTQQQRCSQWFYDLIFAQANRHLYDARMLDALAYHMRSEMYHQPKHKQKCDEHRGADNEDGT